MEKLKFKYVIIGAGVSGLSTAYELSKVFPGEILVLEKDEIVGGLCKTINKNNSYYDLGSHRIHSQVSEKFLEYIGKVSDSEIIKNTRGGKLRLKKSFITYPIKSFQFFISLGLIESILCAISLIKYRILNLFRDNKKSISNYEEYLINNAGKRAYKIFYEPYAVKVWGCEPRMISTTAVKKRMSMTNPIKFVKEMVTHYFKKKNSNYYYYMNRGIGDFAKGIEKHLIENKVQIKTNIKNFELKSTDNTHYIEFSTLSNENFTIEFDSLISTVPIDQLVMKLNPVKEIVDVVEKVKWRGLKLVYVHINEEPILPGETFYFPEIKYIFGRISIPKRFSNYMQTNENYTSFVCEVPCSEGDEKWNMKPEEIYQRCFNDLIKANLIKGTNGMTIEKNFIIDTPKVYPMFTIGWQKTLNKLLEYLQQNYKHIYTSGKCGFFMHCNMDHSIDVGILLAKYIIEGKTPEDWYNNIDKFHSLKLRD